jgi:hypothetical protein
MPVQVNEMVIRASVGDTVDTRNVTSSLKTPPDDDEAKQTMISECVAQVLEILRRENIR